MNFITLLILTASFVSGLENRFAQVIGQQSNIKDTLLFDPSFGYVYRVRLKNNRTVLDTLEIIPLDRYLMNRLESCEKEEFYKAVVESTEARASSTGEGLVPDIDIPIKFPKGLTFLGEGAKLKIDGRQELTFSGGTSRSSYQRPTEYSSGSAFPQIQIDQRLQVRLTGTVGKKINVFIDHDSERENELKNKISLRYEGDEDEVVKLIEAGDTRFNFPHTTYASFPNVREGLFGIKTELQFANLKVTALATKEQGESRTGSFVSGASVETTTIYDNEYVRRKFFWLGETDSIVQLDVFIDNNNSSDDSTSGAIHGFAYFYDIDSDVPDTEHFSEGYFNWLQLGEDYSFIPGSNILELSQPLGENYILAVHYVTASGKEVGWLGDTTELHLKLIRPRSFTTNLIPIHPQNADEYVAHVLYSLELKNVYRLPSRNIIPEWLQISIYKRTGNIDLEGENQRLYISILGIDPENDGQVNEHVTINGRTFTVLDYVRGYLIFPNPYPFADTGLSEPDTIIYWKQQLDPGEGRKYYIRMIYRNRSDQIRLNATDIIEGSEVVTYNGRKLKRGRDYTIDYDLGIITIINEDILSDPNADIRVTYDYAPFMSTKERSILGLRFQYDVGDLLSIGSSWITRSEGTIDERPRVGEEPTRAAIGELDMTLNLDMPGVTDFLDRLPLLTADGQSRVTLNFETARAFPNPNVKGDGYIDDMESTKNSEELPVSNRLAWTFGSVPVGKDTADFAEKLIWATVQDFRLRDIYPDRPSSRADERASVMMLIMRPSEEGDTAQWASLNTLVSRFGKDFSHYDFLEVVTKGDGVKLHIDVGFAISEDGIWRDKAGKIRGYQEFNTEDLNGDGHHELSTEDVGLDGVAGDDDRWTPESADDGNDDYDYEFGSNNFERINGTEGNGHFDTEDLNGDHIFDTSNAYFEFTIDLDDFANPYLIDETPTGWKHYRIPIHEVGSHIAVGRDTTWEKIYYARIWVSGFTRTDTIYIERIEFVGNYWLNYGVHRLDTTYEEVDSTEQVMVGVVSNYETVGYTPPPIRLKRDASGKIEHEQSLAVVYQDIKKGHFVLVHRALSQRHEHDLLDYKNLRFFVRSRNPLNYEPICFIRLGSDTMNFYEYRFRLQNPTSWHDISIPLDRLSHLKNERPEDWESGKTYYSGQYGVRGNPNLGRISMYEFGILNDSSDAPISGELWFDELRVSNPRREGGMAMRGNMQVDLGGILSFSGNIQRRDPEFRSLSETRPSRSLTTSYQINTSVNLQKLLLPQRWGFSIPLSFRVSGSYSYPKYLTGSDIILTKDEMRQQRQIDYSREASFRLRKSGSRSELAKMLLSAWDLNASMRENISTSPLRYRYSLHRSVGVSYNYSPGFRPIKILGKDFRFWLSNFGISTTYSYDSSLTYDKQSHIITKPLPSEILSFDGNASFSPINNLTFSYKQRQEYNMAFGRERWGKQVSMREELSGRLNLNFFGLISPNLNASAVYNEQIPNARTQLSDTSFRYKNITQTTNFSVSSSVDPLKFLRGFRKDTSNFLKMFGYYVSRFVNMFPAPSLSYSNTRSYSFYYITHRPDVRFRLGLRSDPGIDLFTDTRNSKRINESYRISGRIALPRLSLNYQGDLNISHSFSPSSGEFVTRTFTWPNLSTSFSQIYQIIPYANKIFSSMTLGLSYSRRVTERGPVGRSTPDSRSTEHTLTPSLRTSFKNSLTWNLDGSMSWTKEEVFTFRQPSSNTRTWNISSNLSYTLRRAEGIKLPFIGSLSLKSEVTFNLIYRITDQTTEQAGLISGSSSRELTLNAQYRFTRNITGRLEFRRTSTTDKTTKRTFTSTMLNANVVLNF